MPGQLESPPSGGMQNTPRTDAPTASGADGLPGSDHPTSGTEAASLLQERFRAGYGKGAEKGRREGQQSVLEELGYQSLDDLRAALQPSQSDKAADITNHPQYRDALSSAAKLERKTKDLEQQMTALVKRADQARLDKLRAAALAAGVGAGRQLDAFVAMFGDRVAIGDDMQLEVNATVNGTTIPTGQSIEQWLSETLAEARFLLAPDRQRGAGSRAEPLAAAQTGPDLSLFGVPARKKKDGSF